MISDELFTQNLFIADVQKNDHASSTQLSCQNSQVVQLFKGRAATAAHYFHETGPQGCLTFGQRGRTCDGLRIRHGW